MESFFKLYKGPIKNIIFISIFLLCIKNYSNYDYFLRLNKSDFYDYSKLVMIKQDNDLNIFNQSKKNFVTILKHCIEKMKWILKFILILFNVIRKIND